MSDEELRRTRSLADALDGFLKREGMLELSREKMCPLVWGEVVGAWYSRFTRITRVHEGIVFVRCDSAPRANQLQLDAPDIIARLNERLGGRYVKELRPSSTGAPGKTVEWDREDPLDPPTSEELAAIELEPGEEERIRARAEEMQEPELREGLERVLQLRARLRVWQKEHGFTCCPECGGYYRGTREYCYACRPAPPPPREGGEKGLSPYRRSGGEADGEGL